MDAEQIRTADLEVIGHLSDASNAAILVQLSEPGGSGPVCGLYKPIRGERPLWDFPDGYLAHRERAAYVVSELGGWHLVPPTALRDGPFGPGSVQLWVTPVSLEHNEAERTLILADPSPSEQDVVLVPTRRIPDGFLPVVPGRMADGRSLVVAHADSAELASVACFDAVLNNGDRKGSHLLRDAAGRLWGIDHGVSLHTEDKLRTVLWGFRGRRIPETDLDRVRALLRGMGSDHDAGTELARLLTAAEVQALTHRAEQLLATGRFPQPHGSWPSVPWPPL